MTIYTPGNIFREIKGRVSRLSWLVRYWRLRRALGTDRLLSYENLDVFNKTQLLSVLRHQSHRIEKAFYNKSLDAKAPYYRAIHAQVVDILKRLTEKHGMAADHPVLAWAHDIANAFEHFEIQFFQSGSTTPRAFRPDSATDFLAFLRGRRSCRVWAAQQLKPHQLDELFLRMVDAARWAPCSGNRQPWRFKRITTPGEREALRGLKEPHCLAAPLLIFIGMETSVYGTLGRKEAGIYIDAGASIMQMVLLAEQIGLGSCWNHFAPDLIYSRPQNPERYARFAKICGIPDSIRPIAILALGLPERVTPCPARAPVDELLL